MDMLDKSYNNPFQLSDEIRKEIIRRSEETGARALNWSLSSFDKIGGANTLRSVWAKLKGKKRVKGCKRAASVSDSDSPDDARKKTKISLNLSSTCDKMDKFKLGSSTSSALSSTCDRLDNFKLGTSTSSGCSAPDSCCIRGVPNERNDNLLNVSVSASDAHESDRVDGSELGVGEEDYNTSNSLPSLALPSPETLSSDSGRSDTWCFTGGILRGVRSVRACDVERGTVTETGPRMYITDGFTSDGVVDTWGSSVSSISSWRLPISSTTDEGLGGEETRNAYVDDEIWVRESEESEDGWNADVDRSESDSPTNSNDGWESSNECHGREPSIAGDCGGVGCHGREPSIANECHGRELSIAEDCFGGVGCHGREPSIADECHGREPSIAEHCDGSDTTTNCHGREPSIANSTREGGVIDLGCGLDIVSHGREPSIANSVREGEVDDLEWRANIASGREPNIEPDTLSVDKEGGMRSNIVNEREHNLANGNVGRSNIVNECEHNLANGNLGRNALFECNRMPVEVKPDSQPGIRDEPCGGDWVGGDQVSVQITSSTLYSEEEIPYNLGQGEEFEVEEAGGEVSNVGFDDEKAKPDGSEGNVDEVDE